jgi:hypothetical protein
LVWIEELKGENAEKNMKLCKPIAQPIFDLFSIVLIYDTFLKRQATNLKSMFSALSAKLCYEMKRFY